MCGDKTFPNRDIVLDWTYMAGLPPVAATLSGIVLRLSGTVGKAWDSDAIRTVNDPNQWHNFRIRCINNIYNLLHDYSYIIGQGNTWETRYPITAAVSTEDPFGATWNVPYNGSTTYQNHTVGTYDWMPVNPDVRLVLR